MNQDRVIAVRNAKTIYRDGDRCLKVFNAEYSKADVLNEALNQARIEETGLHIPKVLEVTAQPYRWHCGSSAPQCLQEPCQHLCSDHR